MKGHGLSGRNPGIDHPNAIILHQEFVMIRSGCQSIQ
jgi:hypothetical protein